MLPRLLALPAHTLASDVRAWAGAQTGPATLREYLSAGLRRLLALPAAPADAERRGALLRAVADTLVEASAPQDREKLAADVAALLRSGRLPSPTGRAASRLPVPPAASQRRLTLVFDRLDSPGAARGGGGRAPLLGEAALTAALAASSPAALDSSLQEMRRRGLFHGTDELFHALVQALPAWPLPDLTARTAPAAAALERLVSLAPDTAEAKRRFGELVDAGAATFNQGALERAELVYGVAERLIDRGVLEASAVEPLRAAGHERLDLERLGRLLEGEDPREVPRSLLRFYRVFDPSALLDTLRREPARRRRRLLLAFLEAHGTDGRHAAFERLGRRLEDQQDVFLGRNLVHLLRRIPGERSPWVPGRELARVVRLLVPENPPFLVREVLAYLAEKRHPVAEQALRHFVTTLEECLLGDPAGGSDAERDQWRHSLDDTCSALARHGTPGAWQAVVDHGLRTEPELGRAAARLAELGGRDLAGHPALVARLVAAAISEIPRRLLARPSAAQAERLRHLVAALADTHSADVRELLETLAGRFPDEDFGRCAARVLANAGAAGPFDPSAGATLSGDLRVFGLPTMLQSLADSRVTGAMTLLDLRGRVLATLELEGGLFAGARYGGLEGDDVVYQLIERPLRATFVFVPRPRGAGGGGHDAAPAKPAPTEVTRVLLEGLRRHDELRRASVIVPDDARLATTERAPRAVAGEEDFDLVISLWEKVAAGMTPQQCEKTLAADAYRVRRCLLDWVEDGALRLGQPGPR